MLQFSNSSAIDGLHHFVTTRIPTGGEGHSSGAYASLNLAYHVGDDANHVSANRYLSAEMLGYDARALVAARQVHGALAHVVREAGAGALDEESALAGIDALIVAKPGIPVLIMVADCAPILLADPVHRVLAVVHAGWRGAVARIAGAAVARMVAEFGSDPASILAGIGPCLCVECLEIGPEVAAVASPICPDAVHAGLLKPHLDLRALISHDLESAGVPTQNVELMSQCPKCLPDVFFSHRGQNGVAGRFGLVAWWETSKVRG